MGVECLTRICFMTTRTTHALLVMGWMRAGELSKQSCSWFYNTVGHKYRRFGSAKVVRSLYKSSSYCKLRHVITQGGLNSNRLIIITNQSTKDSNNNKAAGNSKANISDTELDHGYTGSGESRSFQVTSRMRNLRPPLPAEFLPQSGDNDGDEDDDEDSDELPSPKSTASNGRPSIITRSLGGHHPVVTRAGSVDTLNLLSSESSTSSSKRHKTRTPDTSASSRSLLTSVDQRRKLRTPDPGGARARWDDVGGGYVDRKAKKETKEDIYKHASENARQAEEHKFRTKFDVLLNDLHRTLDRQLPTGLTDSFASTSYGEVMLLFRGRVKDLLVGFTQRLQLAYESFDKSDPPEDHSQQVKHNVSRLLEDLLGESLDLTSDEAVSDLSSLSDESGSDRHAFEDQIAQAVVSKILDNHRREVHHSLSGDFRSQHLSSSLLIPEALADEAQDESNGNERLSSSPKEDNGDVSYVRDTDISKDFEDLRNFVQETQTRSRHLSDSCPGEETPDGEGNESWVVPLTSARVGSSAVSNASPETDFSQFDMIKFFSGEVDPDLLQMNLDVIPEETEDQLVEERDVADTHWRENWIFKGQVPVSAHGPQHSEARRLRGDDSQPQYMMVPEPDDDLAPQIGNTDVHQLSDLSDNEHLADEDDTNPFYTGTSEELARSSPKHPQKKKSASSSPNVEVEDVSVGTDDLVASAGPIVEKTPKELKLVENLVPAEGNDPRFVVEPENVTVEEGEPLKLSCRVSGTQPVDVFWYREQQKVEELEEGEDVDMQVQEDSHQLTLYNLSKHQTGQYLCIALSEQGKAVKYFTVTVRDNKQELKKPEFLKELKDMEVLEGQSVKFRCKVKGYPQPRINWYKDGKLLKHSRSCRIEKFGNRDYILTLDYATMDDDAEYMVVAKNVAGEVRCTAQVIVEPYAEDHPLLLKSSSRSQSMSTVYTDTESERPSSLLLDDFMPQSAFLAGHEEVLHRPSSPGDSQVDSLISKMSATKNTMRQEAESMLATADELSALSHHLEDMERHLDSLEGHSSSCSNRNSSCLGGSRPPYNRTGRLQFAIDNDTALAIIADDRALSEASRNVRKLTSNALSVLRAAEEIIQSEKRNSSVSYMSPRQGSCSSLILQPHEESSRAMDQSSVTSHSDMMNQSVSSGYGTLSMTSSAMDDNSNEDVTHTEPSLPKQLGQDDDFALYLPPLLDPTASSGAYREEVSIRLSPSKTTRAGGGAPSSLSSSSSTLTESSASSVSTSSAMTIKSLKDASQVENTDVAKSVQTQPFTTGKSGYEEGANAQEEKSLVLNFGPKDINPTAYSRDYEVTSGRKEVEVAERKRWSVTLDPFVPTAEVVNRQPSLEETEEQIYLSASRLFHIEDRVKELQARVGDQTTGSFHSGLSRLEDQVAHTAASVARSEKEVASIEHAVHSLQQCSPRSSIRSSNNSNSSTTSTPRESIDSGVSTLFTTGAPMEGQHQKSRHPAPVYMVGHTQECDMPDSRTEFDADSGIELPSVHRLRALFGGGPRSSGKEDEEGGFKRVHSITARSLNKDQLQTLRDAGNTTLPDPRETHSSTTTLRLHTASGQSADGRKSQEGEQKAGSFSSFALSSQHPQQEHQRSVVKKQARTTDLLPGDGGQYKDLDPSKQPVLIYPEVEKLSVSTSAALSSSLPAKAVSSVAVQPSSEASSPAAVSIPHLMPVSSSVPGAGVVSDGQGGAPGPRIMSGCISARAAFWERRIMQGEVTDVNVEEEFPEMVQESNA